MFKRSFRSQDRVDKAARLKKSTGSVRDPQQKQQLSKRFQQSFSEDGGGGGVGNNSGGVYPPGASPGGRSNKSLAPSPIVTLTVGREGRLFAAHEDVLCQSAFFEAACRGQYLEAQGKRISLPDEEPEIFSAILEYLYKGDYYPRLLPSRQHRNSWELEDSVRPSPHTSPQVESEYNNNNHHYHGSKGVDHNHHHRNTASSSTAAVPGPVEATIYMASEGTYLLRDTVIYCAADRYGLEELKRLALRKQGLQSGIDVGTILRSAQYAYANTPDSDSRLRAHYLALIIRCRRTFKRSGTMQTEMERGGSKLFFDLFVAMCNHLDDVVEMSNSRTPKTI